MRDMKVISYSDFLIVIIASIIKLILDYCFVDIYTSQNIMQA